MQNEQETLHTLREIRDGQRQIIELLTAHKAMAEEEMRRSQERIDESIGLQKRAVGAQGLILRIALPAVIACVALIFYLNYKYL